MTNRINSEAAVVSGNPMTDQLSLGRMPNRRRRCRCGCGGAATHFGTANRVPLISGCEWRVRRWLHEWQQRRGMRR